MVFSSLVFLCVFLPVVFVLYTIIPSLKVKNALLITASLLFYAYGEPIYVLLMIFSSFINYIFALLVDKKKSKLVLAAAVVINLGILAVFKYTGFFVETVNSVFNASLPVPQIVLPIGISFFTFQALSYVIDVYRRNANVQKSFFSVLLYVSFFPQLIAGPIVKYKDIDDQIRYRVQTVDKCAEGVKRFIFGLAKKVLISNTMGQVADAVFNADSSYLSIATAWLGAITYLFQIYFDFSGYSDMAIGLGKMFGFEFRENFNYPYGATSIQDFWRKWHISLSTWFKEYLYIPLGGSRKGKGRTVINKFIVFFCTGLWHGASWTFVIWGLYHGFFLFLEEFIPIIKRLPKLIRHCYTLLVVTVGFVIFRAETLSQGLVFIKNMFAGYSVSDASASLALSQITPWFIVMLIAAVIACAPFKALTDKVKSNASFKGSKTEKAMETAAYICSFVLLVWCVARLAPASYNAFIYFRF